MEKTSKNYAAVLLAAWLFVAVALSFEPALGWEMLNESTGNFSMGDQPSGTFDSEKISSGSGFSETFSNPSANATTPSDSGGGGGITSATKSNADAIVSYEEDLKKQQDAIQIENTIKSDVALQQTIKDALGLKELSAEKISEISAASAEVAKSISSSRSIFITSAGTTFSLSFSYGGSSKISNFVIYDVVPKSFAPSSDNITVIANGAIVKIVQKDPVYSFTYPEISKGESKTISYSVNKQLDKSVLNNISVPLFLAGKLVEQAAAPSSIPPSPPPTTTEKERSPEIPEGGGASDVPVIAVLVALAVIAIIAFYAAKKGQGIKKNISSVTAKGKITNKSEDTEEAHSEEELIKKLERIKRTLK